jgi:hypothetical protein
LPSQSNAPVSATPAPGEWNTYTDAAYGYSFDYPASWFLTPAPSKGGDTILYSYDPSTAPGIGGPLPKDKLKVLFWVAKGVDKPIPEWLADGDDSPGQITPPTVISLNEFALDGRTGFVRVIESSGEQLTSYYVRFGADMIFVVNAGASDSLPWSQFETVLASVNLP